MKKKVYFYILLTAAVKYFKEFSKEEEENFVKEENERAKGETNKKLLKMLNDNFQKGLKSLKGSHQRFLDASGYILKRYIPKYQKKGIEEMDNMATFVSVVIENTMKKEDCPKIIHLIKLYNSGAFNEFFDKIEKKAEETIEASTEEKGKEAEDAGK